MTQAYIALGGNLAHKGTPVATTLRLAIQAIEKHGFTVKRTSRFFQTPAFPAGSGPDYINAVLQLEVWPNMSPAAIFSPLAQIELTHGRQRTGRWAGRTLDIDLLAIEGVISPSLAQFHAWADLDPAWQAKTGPSDLIVPHPRLHERSFVLVPMMDIAPDWVHPVYQKTVRQMCAALTKEQRGSVVALDV